MTRLKLRRTGSWVWRIVPPVLLLLGCARHLVAWDGRHVYVDVRLPFTTKRATAPRTDGVTFPKVRLWTHEGRPVRFYEDLVKDKTVLINFMYTSCNGT